MTGAVAVALSRPGAGELVAFDRALAHRPPEGRSLLLASAELALGDPRSPRCGPRLARAADRVAATGLVLVGARWLHARDADPTAGRPDFARLLEQGARVIPGPTLLSRDGMPAVRRALATLPAPDLGVAVQLGDWLTERGAADALIGVARAVARYHREGRVQLRSIDLCDWDAARAADPAAAALLGRLLAALLQPAAAT